MWCEIVWFAVARILEMSTPETLGLGMLYTMCCRLYVSMQTIDFAQKEKV